MERPKPWWAKKWLKLANRNRCKTQTRSVPAVNLSCFANNNSAFLSLSTVSSSSSFSSSSSASSSSFPHNELEAAEGFDVSSPIQAPSNQDGDDHRVNIREAATSNPVDEQKTISSVSSELSPFQKSDMSKLVLTIAIPMIIGLLGLNALISTPENESKSPSPLPENKPIFPPFLNAFVAFVLLFGITFIFIGILLRDIVPRTANVWEAVGVLLVCLGFFSAICWMMPDWLKLAPWLCYIVITITIQRSALSDTA